MAALRIAGRFVTLLGLLLATAAYSLVFTVLLFLLVDKTVGFRAEARDEDMGLDLSQHGEEGYGS